MAGKHARYGALRLCSFDIVARLDYIDGTIRAVGAAFMARPGPERAEEAVQALFLRGFADAETLNANGLFYIQTESGSID